MKFRHEWKHEINFEDRLVLLARLSAVMKRDSHSIGGEYKIRSLYFDTPGDKALREKIDGVNAREKFRIRLYNGDPSFIVLEKKSKLNGLCAKESCRLTAEEAQRIADKDADWLISSGRPLCAELYSKMKSQGLRPKTIVDYTREAFVFPAGNDRVTIDRDGKNKYIEFYKSCTGDPERAFESVFNASSADIEKSFIGHIKMFGLREEIRQLLINDSEKR